MVELIPRRVLFGNPSKTAPALSPDGKRLAYVAPHEGVLNVWVGDVGADNARPVTTSRDRPVRAYVWTHLDGRLIYLLDRDGNEQAHAYLVDVSSGQERDLTPFEGVSAQVAGLSHRVPGVVVLGVNREDRRFHDAWAVDLKTGDARLSVRNPGMGTVLGNWIVDADLEPRGGLRQRPDGGVEVIVREAGDEWRVVYAAEPEDYLNFRAVGFTGDGKGLYLITPRGYDTARLIELSLVTGEETLLYGEDDYDVSTVRLHPTTRNVQMVGVYRDRLALHAVDPSVAPDLERLTTLDPGELHVLGGDVADEHWLVMFVHDDAPNTYHSYRRPSGELTELFEDRPELSSYALAKTQSFHFNARDGLVINGYLTFPPQVTPSDLPTVLYVHGGPWHRDTWAGNKDTIQWFANRGYLCVQVNYRGSTGYGSRFVNAADHEWAGEMHDDLIDAVEFVVAKGYADRSRIGIYGGSYGGYAALVGATFTPDVFACAVDIVGPSSLITLLSNIPPWWKPWESLWHAKVGHPERDRDFLWSRSPLSRVDQIRIPLLIGQGANDPRVTRVESEQIVEEMKRKGIPHTYLLFADEGHGFAKPNNAMRFSAEAERFLAEHLGGRYEPSA